MASRAGRRIHATVLDVDDAPRDDDAFGLRDSIDLAFTAATGDARATAALLVLVAPAVQRAVRTILGSRGVDRVDVNQQAMLNVVRALPGFRGDCHPAGYAARVAVHTALSARDERVRSCDPGDPAEVAAPGGKDGDGAPAAHRQHLLRDVLGRLPAEQAEILALHVVLGQSLAEVAQVTATPLDTVKSRFRLAKEAVRRRLNGDSTGSRRVDQPGDQASQQRSRDGATRP